MQFKPIISFKKSYGAAKLILLHDFSNGLWSLAVSLALFLGLLPEWLTSSKLVNNAATPEKYTLLQQ
jgi:hypothetical protein